MTAREEINMWMEKSIKVKNESEKQELFKEIREKLHSKTPEEHRENLMALKAAAIDFRKEVEAKLKES